MTEVSVVHHPPLDDRRSTTPDLLIMFANRLEKVNLSVTSHVENILVYARGTARSASTATGLNRAHRSRASNGSQRSKTKCTCYRRAPAMRGTTGVRTPKLLTSSSGRREDHPLTAF